jgi:hypothetical protein
MATSLGVTVGSDGNLYEVFSDGSRKLKEAGYQARMDAYVKQLNSTVNAPGPAPSAASTTAAATTVTPTPPTPTTGSSTASSVVSSSSTSQVKSATKDIILFDDGAVPIDLMADLIFEDIGGQELINIARRDTVNGQKISYQPIKNLSSIEQQYNPNNIISLQATSDKYFANFPIKLDDKIPQLGGGPEGDYVYIDTVTGNLVVEAVNLEVDEQIEIQIARSGTIYETDFN